MVLGAPHINLMPGAPGRVGRTVPDGPSQSMVPRDPGRVWGITAQIRTVTCFFGVRVFIPTFSPWG